MNCQCVPSKPAVVRVSQSARSGGREFFCCPINNGCGFFAWVGQDIPMSLAFGRNRPQTTGKPSSYGVGSSRSSNSPQKTNGKFEAKICVHEILEGPPFVIWLSLQCPATPVINDLFSRLPPQQCKFSNTLKMWLFTFEMHDKIVTEFFTPPFESLRLVDLPRFLSKGLANFQRKVLKLNWELEPALNLNAGILDKLLNFQLEAVKFVVRRGGRAMLGDEMGKIFLYWYTTNSKIFERKTTRTFCNVYY